MLRIVDKLICALIVVVVCGLPQRLCALDNEDVVVVRPREYPGALRNPMKGFTNRGFRENKEWATLVHCYIPWNQIENDESDDIGKIRKWCDARATI